MRFKPAPPTLKSLPRTQNACHGVQRSSIFHQVVYIHKYIFSKKRPRADASSFRRCLAKSSPNLSSQHPDPKLASSSLPHFIALGQSSYLASSCHLAPRNILQKIVKKQYLLHCFFPTKASHVWG